MDTTASANTPTMNAARAASRETGGPVKGRLVTDAPTRMFHALFALSFAGAYLTAESEHWRLLHVTLGYAFAGLLAFRLVYGLIGPRHVRLAILWRKLAGAKDGLLWFRQPTRATPFPWKQGQHIAMALAIALMLLLVVPLTLSGYATYNDWGDVLGGDWIEDLHELVANTFLFTIAAHLGMMALLSLLRGQNLALPMCTGRMPGPGASPVQRNRLGLALLMLLAVLAFVVWQLWAV